MKYTHTHTHTHTHIHTHTVPLSLSLSLISLSLFLSHTHTHPLSLSLIHTHTHTDIHIYIHIDSVFLLRCGTRLDKWRVQRESKALAQNWYSRLLTITLLSTIEDNHVSLIYLKNESWRWLKEKNKLPGLTRNRENSILETVRWKIEISSLNIIKSDKTSPRFRSYFFCETFILCSYFLRNELKILSLIYVPYT